MEFIRYDLYFDNVPDVEHFFSSYEEIQKDFELTDEEITELKETGCIFVCDDLAITAVGIELF